MSRLRPIPIVLGLLVLTILWFTRPVWHGLAMFFWTAPLVWFPPLVVLLVGGWLLRRRRRGWTTVEELRSGVRPPAWLLAFPVVAFILLVLGGSLQGALTGRSIVTATTYEEIGGLPPGGEVRLVPREVAEVNATSAFNSPTEKLTDFRITNTEDGLRWTALRTPQGTFRTFSRRSEGLVVLDAEQTARSLRQVDAEFATAPGMQITDNLRWRLLKERYFIELEDPVGIETGDGPRILVPYLEFKGWLVRRPVLGGVFVVHPDGEIEDLEPEEAAKRPELARSGRIFPDTQARRIHDAFQYRKGLWNAWFVHEDQTQITDTEVNRQPYMIVFPELGPQWVTVAEPYGRASAASVIFLTDAVTGRTRIWRVPRRTSLSGNQRALQAVRAVSIPGVDFGDEGSAGNFRVVEPRPVFVDGRVVYLTSIIPRSANAVSKTVVVDAETNKLVAIFDNDRDPQAEAKTLRYIQTGEVPADSTAAQQTQEDGEDAEEPEPDDPTSTSTTPAEPEDVERRLDELVDRQREILEEIEDLRDQVRRENGGG